MTLVTVVRHVPPPIIGMIGVLPERRFAAFENDLDWLETTGVVVERLAPGDPPPVGSPPSSPDQLLTASPGDGPSAVILVDGIVASRGGYPTRAELVRLVGRGRQRVRTEVARELATSEERRTPPAA